MNSSYRPRVRSLAARSPLHRRYPIPRNLRDRITDLPFLYDSYAAQTAWQLGHYEALAFAGRAVTTLVPFRQAAVNRVN